MQQLRRKFPSLFTINSPRETIMGFNLMAKRRGKSLFSLAFLSMANNNGNLKCNIVTLCLQCARQDNIGNQQGKPSPL